MFYFRRLAFLVVWFLPLLALAQAPRPNVIIIYTDDQHRDEFGYEGGHNATPNIDRLASEGLRFDHFYVPTALCAPSRIGLQTGRYPSSTPPLVRSSPVDQDNDNDGQGDPPYVLQTLGDEQNRPAEIFNLPHTLQQSGYTTGTVGKWHLGFLGSRRTPGRNLSDLLHNFALAQESAYAAGYDYAEAMYHDNVQPDNFDERYMAHNPEWIAWKAREFIETQSAGDDPFFLVVNPTLPHWPQADDSRFDSLVADKAITGIGDRQDALNLPEGDPVREEILAIGDEAYDADGFGVLSGMRPRDTIASRAAASGFGGGYREDIVWLDDMVGGIVAKVEDLGIQDDTLIMVISDHGRSGKWSNWERGTSSGALAWWPNTVPAGKRSGDLVANVDLAPTLFELAGASAAPDADLHGVSIAPHLLDPDNTPSGRDYAFSEIRYERAITRSDGMKIMVSMADGDPQGETLGDTSNPIIRLYDMGTGSPRQEGANVVNDPAYADELEEMLELMREQSLRLPHEFGEFTQGAYAPVITTPPADQEVIATEDAVFTVEVDAFPSDVSYQWLRDGEPVGEDAATLTLASVALADDGAQITVEVANSEGSADTSASPATLTVLPPPTEPPAAPSGLTATVQGFSEIVLNWIDESSTESGFVIERRSGSEAFAEIAQAPEDAVTWTDQGLASDTTYFYRIRSTNLAGESGYAAAAFARTPLGSIGGDLLDSEAGMEIATGGDQSVITDVTVPSLPNGALVVTVGSEGSNPNAGPAAIRFAGEPLTEAVAAEVAATHASIWYLVNPPPATDSIEVDWGSSQFGAASLAYYLLQGVDANDPVAAADSSTTGGDSSLEVTLTGGTTDGIAIDSVATNNNVTSGLSFGPGQIEAWKFGTIGGGASHGTSYEENAGVDPTQSVAWSGSERAAYAAAMFRRAPAPPEVDAFGDWAADSGLDGQPGSEAGPADNPDFDPWTNVAEWVFASDPLGRSSAPAFAMNRTVAGDGFTFSFPRADSSEDFALVELQFSRDLFQSDINRVVIGPVSTVEVDGCVVSVDENGEAADQVTVEMPDGAGDVDPLMFIRFRLEMLAP